MTGPAPRRHIGALPRYQPGRSVEAAMAEHGIASAVKLASNEVPFGPLPGVPGAVEAVLSGTHRYADHLADAVATAFAEHVGVTRDRVAVGPGSVGLLEQIALAYAGAGDRVVYPWPSFIAYPQFTCLTGADPAVVPLRRQRVDARAIVEAIDERTRLVLLANANNPTSTALTRSELRRIVDAAPADCLVVIDEAYHEFATSPAIPDAIAEFGDRENVAVLRTLSKAYGLAGLRVGFLVAAPEVVDAVAACAIPFAVNAAGQAAAVAALAHGGDGGEVHRRCAVITAERERVARQLRERGIGVPRGHGNYWWLAAGAQAGALAAALEARGVVTRALDGGVRVTVGLPEENDRFLAAIEHVLGEDPDTSPFAADWGVATGAAAQRLGGWLDRLAVARQRFEDHLGRSHPGRTAPVPGEEETWDAGQVWAHVAEFGDYWLEQLGRLLDAAAAAGDGEPVPFGRTRHDPERIAAIAAGRHGDAADHFATVEDSAERLAQTLSGLTRGDWRARGKHETLGVMDLEAQLADFHVGHYEQHADQLDSIL